MTRNTNNTTIETLESRRMFSAAPAAGFCGPLPLTEAEIHTNAATPLLQQVGPVQVSLAQQAAIHTENASPFLHFIGPVQTENLASRQSVSDSVFVGPVPELGDAAFSDKFIGPTIE